MQPITADGEDQVVAAGFAFVVNAVAEVPCDGMKEQNCFKNSLHNDQQMIVTSQVRQFMREHEFQLLGR